MSEKLRICIIASSRFPVAEPFAGGLEAHTHELATELTRRGHDVTLFAGPGSDETLNTRILQAAPFRASEAARGDVHAWPEAWMSEHHAYLGLMLELAATGARDFNIVHNNSLHHLPIAMARSLDIPMVTTLHTPPIPWLESAMTFAAPDSVFAAVSVATSRAWSASVDSSVVYNGVDTERWTPGAGGGDAVWFGRLVPEKGAHLAIRAALTCGIPIDLAGPIGDSKYFDSEVRPLLGPTARYLGHLSHRELVPLVGAASVALATPRWDEPYGLVAAEAMSCGTPVAAFARGALGELVNDTVGRLARPDDVFDLARAMLEARELDRAAVRRHAERFCSLSTMTDAYETLYRGMVSSAVAA